MSLALVHAYGVAGLVGPEAIGRRRYGVPPSGAFDRGAGMLANALLGLAEGSPVWELGMANARFRALADGMLAVVGAPVAVSVDGHGAAAQAAFPVHAGAEIHIGPPDVGARAYVAFRPGALSSVRRLSPRPTVDTSSPFRVVQGPQAAMFDLRALEASRFTVGMASNRVGIRLGGPFAPHTIELPSEPACVGAIQATSGGELLILGPDGPTIGGYPKIAVVIDADRDRLAQLRPGASVSFAVVSLAEAIEARSARLDRLGRWTAGLRLGAV